MRKYYLLLAFASFNVFGQDFFVDSKVAPQKHQFSVSSANTIAGYPILIPDDQWKFMFSMITYSAGTGSGLPLGNVYGAKISDDNILQYAIDMQANLAQRGDIGDWTDEPCKGNDHLWMKSIGGKFNNINCATINVNPSFQKHAASTYLQVYGKSRSINYSIPSTTIEVAFTRYSSSGRRLQYKVNINPAYHGFAPEVEENKYINSWNKTFYLKDEKKKQFIESISRWAGAVQDNMDKAFSGDKLAFLAVTNYISLNKNENSPKETAPAITEKLKSTKKLFDEKLITEFQYNEQVKMILSGQ